MRWIRNKWQDNKKEIRRLKNYLMRIHQELMNIWM